MIARRSRENTRKYERGCLAARQQNRAHRHPETLHHRNRVIGKGKGRVAPTLRTRIEIRVMEGRNKTRLRPQTNQNSFMTQRTFPGRRRLRCNKGQGRNSCNSLCAPLKARMGVEEVGLVSVTEEAKQYEFVLKLSPGEGACALGQGNCAGCWRNSRATGTIKPQNTQTTPLPRDRSMQGNYADDLNIPMPPLRQPTPRINGRCKLRRIGSIFYHKRQGIRSNARPRNLTGHQTMNSPAYLS